MDNPLTELSCPKPGQPVRGFGISWPQKVQNRDHHWATSLECGHQFDEMRLKPLGFHCSRFFRVLSATPTHFYYIKNSNLEIEETKLKLPIIPCSILMNFLCVIIIVVYVCGHCVCVNLECLKCLWNEILAPFLFQKIEVYVALIHNFRVWASD